MFKFFCYLSMSGKIKDIPKGYYSIDADPSYRMGYAEMIICRQPNPSFDEILHCLKKCFTKANYLGCYSMIYWRHYEVFYQWIKESVASENTENIKVIKKFHKNAKIHFKSCGLFSKSFPFNAKKYKRPSQN